MSKTIKVRDFVVIAEYPTGELQFIRHTLAAEHWDQLHESVENMTLEDARERHPYAHVAKGGSGWSQPYDLTIGR